MWARDRLRAVAAVFHVSGGIRLAAEALARSPTRTKRTSANDRLALIFTQPPIFIGPIALFGLQGIVTAAV